MDWVGPEPQALLEKGGGSLATSVAPGVLENMRPETDISTQEQGHILILGLSRRVSHDQSPNQDITLWAQVPLPDVKKALSSSHPVVYRH